MPKMPKKSKTLLETPILEIVYIILGILGI